MIQFDMTIREMISLAANPSCTGDLYERIVKALEKASGENNLNVTLKSMPADAMIPCIKALRKATGWGLREAKEFCDIVRGRSSYDGSFTGGTPNTVTVEAYKGRILSNEWNELGCYVHIDTYH